MKKIILFLLLLISFSVFSQNPDRFRNGIRTQFVQPDTLSTANRDALTPKLGTIIFHKDTGFSRWEQWDGSDWVAFGGGSGSVNFASILGSPHDNANLGQSLDSTVHKWGNETIDSVKTFLRTPNITPPLVTVVGKNTYYIPYNLNGNPLIRLQTQYWNGSAFVSSGSAGYGSGDGIGIGIGALGNNQGGEVIGIGAYSLQNNTNRDIIGIGQYALQNNTAEGVIGFGSYAGQNNTGYGGTFLGLKSGRNNKGNGSNFFGEDSGNYNTGSTSMGLGTQSMMYNSGVSSSGFGNYSLRQNVGDNNNGFGRNALIYAGGNDNNVFGNNSYSTFIPNTGGNKTFTTSDVNTGTDQVTVTAHSFGATNAVINLQLTTSSALGSGMGNGATNKWKVIDANTLQAISNDITSTGAGTMTLTPQIRYNSVNILGNNLQPTQSDQTILGGATVVGPNTNKAAGIAGGNKVFLTREMGDQLYTGGGGGGTITLPLDATDIADGSVTNTEFEYLNTVTSNIQTQLDGKLDPTDILDEDNMASNSDTHVPSQQSVKAYVDAKDSNVVHRTGIETIAGSKTHTDELKLDSRLYIKPIIGATKAADYATLDVNTDYNLRYVGNGLNNRYILNSNNLTNERIYTLPNKSGTVALMDDLSSSGTSEVAERSLNAGKYHFTSTASNETLTSALVEPATPNLGKKMWRTYTANDTITVPGDLTVGWSSVIEAGPATDSILIKADTGVDIYGQGNSFVQSGTGIDGLWLKKGRTVALIYKGANSVRAEGPWNVANLAPANLYTLANAANPDNEVNAITGAAGVTNYTVSSVSTSPTAQDGTYAIKWTHGGPDNTSYNGNIDITTGLVTGTTYEVRMYVNRVAGGNFTIGLSSGAGWTVSDTKTIDTSSDPTIGVWREVIFTGTRDASGSAYILVNTNSNADTGNAIAVDNIRIYEIP